MLKMKNSINKHSESFCSRLDQAEAKISGIEGKVKEILHSYSNKEISMTTTFKNSGT
jgi:hypothetical protein